MPNRFSKAEWAAYYSKKRIEQQWLQLHLLGLADCETVLEVGPGLGLVTALLVNIGYQVATLDRVPRAFAYPDVPHHERDICDLRGEEIAGYDAIICCETLEHIAWDRVGSVLSAFRRSGAKCLIVSVPYMEFQVTLDVYLNRTTFRQYFSMKKLLFLKDFASEPPGGHQWEVGYRGCRLATWEKRLTDGGWSIARRDFTAHCRSVFHLLQPAP
jgi:SAM-dependent methyltransferase